MTITSGIFNSVNGDRKYNAQWFAEYFASFIGNGVFPNPSTNLQVVEGTNMQTIVRPGKGWINGYYVNNDSNHVLQHDVADGVLKRIDRIVMRLNYLTRQIEIVVKKGIFASTPVAPILQRDTDAYELVLADVLIGNGATVITQANITDQRLNTALCGIVHGVVNQVDTTSIFNQYQSWFEQTKSKNELEIDQWQMLQEQEFNQWFASIRDILDGDVAANLANRISTLEQNVLNHESNNSAHGIGSEPLQTNAQTIRGAINEAFQFANDGKTNIATVIGAPTIVSDAFPKIKSDIQTLKNSLATNLTNKGQPSLGTETLKILVDRVANVNTGKKWANGDVVNAWSVTSVTVNGLSFRPSYIFILGHDQGSNSIQQIMIYNKDFNTTSIIFGNNLTSNNFGTTPITITSDGFSIADAKRWSGSNNHVYSWYAFE
ncbi:TPA: hypothetical protein NJY08_004415 [Salmonella enterica subsp. enterica serovar Typhi str. AG3]|nr:hypothetical protein [Salmonella enterica subsp. enterica serovar Typhi str. AG3]